MEDFKGLAVRGAFARMISQCATLFFRIANIVILARLLDPKDFGIVAMVTVVTGVYDIFNVAGLSSATIQARDLSRDQISNMFWINTAVGAALGALCVVSGPAMAAFYHEPRLVAVAAVMGLGFLVNGAGVQHSALLQRQLRYTTLMINDVIALTISLAVSVIGALAGLAYWALVWGLVSYSACATAGMWIATGFLPGPPRRTASVSSLLRFGGTVTINSLVVYLAYNFAKVLLGRFWGAGALGIYGRAYQIINAPTQSLNAAFSAVALAALSRLQSEPPRFRSYFLKGYGVVTSITTPLTFFFALYAADITLIALGAKWIDAAPVLRLLSPTVFAFGIVNPLAPLMLSYGRQVRSLKLAMIVGPMVVIAVLLGIPHGPTGVAFAYSCALMLFMPICVVWAVRDTPVSVPDILETAGRPFLAAAVAGVCAWLVQGQTEAIGSPMARMAIGGLVMAAIYYFLLLVPLGQRDLYLELLRIGARPNRGASQA
jgi:PST family polysaccharide transporter